MIAIMHVNVKKDFGETVLFAMVRKSAISSFSNFPISLLLTPTSLL